MGKETENMTKIRKEAIERIAKSSQSREFRLDPELVDVLSKLATQKQTTVSTMVNEWIKEKVKENDT
jgi:predicted DNA-binding protein